MNICESHVVLIALCCSNFISFHCTILYILCSVLIGAPRAQSSLESQHRINETGAIFKCTFTDKSTIEKCAPFVFDFAGNDEEINNQYTYNNEKKDFQWLGASMDGGADDNDKFVVSAYYYSAIN